MMRSILAGLVLLLAASCGPSLKIDPKDPYATLHPWNHEWKDVQRITPTAQGKIEAILNETQFVAVESKDFAGGRFSGASLKWTAGANAGKTAIVNRNANNAFELKEKPEAPLAKDDAFEITGLTLEYVVIRKGDGAGESPGPADKVTVHYDGRLASDGKKFDSSYERGEPISFPLNGVIPGWTEGLQKMKAGDEFMFWIPSALGYGEAGAGGDIPPNADLMFRVELLDVQKAAASNDAAWTRIRPWPSDSSDVVRTASGLEYIVIDKAAPDRKEPSLDSVGPWQQECFRADPAGGTCSIVHFRGELEDGSMIDSTFQDQQERVFPIAALVPGWAEALTLMQPGDRWMVRMPSHLLYGDEGDGRIPPSAAVHFEILELATVEVPKTEPPKPAAAGKAK